MPLPEFSLFLFRYCTSGGGSHVGEEHEACHDPLRDMDTPVDSIECYSTVTFITVLIFDCTSIGTLEHISILLVRRPL